MKWRGTNWCFHPRPVWQITFVQLVTFHTFNLYFIYLINFILFFLDASAGYCISFHSFVVLELQLEKRNCCLFHFWLWLSYSWECILNQFRFRFCVVQILFIVFRVWFSFRPGWEFSNWSEVHQWSDKIFNLGFGWCYYSVQICFRYSRPWSYVLGARPMQSSQFWTFWLQILVVAFNFWMFWTWNCCECRKLAQWILK